MKWKITCYKEQIEMVIWDIFKKKSYVSKLLNTNIKTRQV